jgi:exodeoxyribonuclease V gamma subunit
VAALARQLARPLDDPFAADVVVVQSRGMERWLSQRLAESHGVCANVRFPFPRAFVDSLFEAALPGDAPGFLWTAGQLQWAIADALPGHLDAPAFAPLRAYLADDTDGLKRLQLAGVVADRFDQYATYRADLVAAWEAGAEEDWQAVLWRDLADRFGVEHRAARAQRFIEAVQAGVRPTGLPARAALFGIPTLPPLFVQVLAAASACMRVDLYLLSPSSEYFADLRSRRAIARAERASGRSSDELHLEVGHPLLASCGRVGQDFQDVLELHGAPYVELPAIPAAAYDTPPLDTALHVLQHDLLLLVDRPDTGPTLTLDPADRSIAVHVCHAPMREVEVLRDQLQALFDADPTLRPEDVVVMTPDLERYAPYVDAVFGVDEGSPHHLPYRIADRTLRADSAVVDAALGLLDLLDTRMKAPDVLDRLASPPVAARFGVDAAELETIARWVGETGIAWGVDAAHRVSVGQPGHGQNTWSFGLDRMLLGFAMTGGGDTLFGDALPYDEIEGDAADTLAKLLAFTDALFDHRARTRDPRTLAEWVDEVGALIDDLLLATDDEAPQVQRLRDAVGELADAAAASGFDEPLPLRGVRWMLAQRFEQERSSHGFASGGVTIGALLPMRSLPFRVVALLGLDERSFPRRDRPPAFDRITQRPRAGDRTLRDEDRYLFLEAILSARDRLIITYTGRSVRDNKELPPSVVVSELLDWLDRAFPGEVLPSRIVRVRHPLQPFSPALFSGDDRWYSYSPSFAAGAKALLGDRDVPPPFLIGTLEVTPEERRELALRDLERFLGNPARTLLGSRLGLVLERHTTTLADREPLVPDALERYHLAAPLLARALAGFDWRELWPALYASGRFPPGVPGLCVYDEIHPLVKMVADAARPWLAGERLRAVEVDLELPLRHGTSRLVGWLGDVWPGAQVDLRYARLRPHHELAAWVRHLALCAANMPGTPRTTVLVGRHPTKPLASVVQLLPVDPREARDRLAWLVRMFWWAQTRAVAFFPDNSKRYLDDARRLHFLDEEALLAKARNRFHQGRQRDGLADAYVRLLFTGLDPFDPQSPDFPVRLPRLAELVWEPLLSHRRSDPDAPPAPMVVP